MLVLGDSISVNGRLGRATIKIIIKSYLSYFQESFVPAKILSASVLRLESLRISILGQLIISKYNLLYATQRRTPLRSLMAGR